MEICPLTIPSETLLIQMHMQNLNEIRLEILKLSNGNGLRTDGRTYYGRTYYGRTDRHTDGQRENISSWRVQYIIFLSVVDWLDQLEMAHEITGLNPG